MTTAVDDSRLILASLKQGPMNTHNKTGRNVGGAALLVTVRCTRIPLAPRHIVF